MSKKIFQLLLLLVSSQKTVCFISQWQFEGRLIFAPAFVRAPSEMPEGLSSVSFFGLTVGGYVVLEYDASPADRYFEVVEMGSLCFKNGAFGQWGRELFVSTAPAQEACVEIWSVPASLADVDTSEEESLGLGVLEEKSFRIDGWRAAFAEEPKGPRLTTPILWTPEITTLWAPLRLSQNPQPTFPRRLHDLRVSATSIGLKPFELRRHKKNDDDIIWPLPLALCVDGLRIEIAKQKDGENL